MNRRVCALLAAAVVSIGTAGAAGQTAPILSAELKVAVDSGVVQNIAPAGGAALVWSGLVQAPHAPWLRLKFDDVMFAGNLAAGNGAYLLLTSMHDGAQQPMDARAVQDWSKTSAYFNGDSVLVELYAYPGTGPSRVALSSVTAGVEGVGPQPETICGPTDDRVLSNLPANARLMPIGCTAWLIDLGNCANRFLTAGHCIATGTTNAVVQFNVPFSTSGGTPVNPPPQDQYPAITASIQSSGSGGVGLDAAQFFTAANSVTNQAPRFVQNAAYTLASAAPPTASGQDIRVTGYGTGGSGGGTWSQVQKTHTGPFVSRTATSLQYAVDTTGGNSGSPVVLESTGQGIGIHTHAGCGAGNPPGANNGTAIEYPTLQGYLASPLPGCIPFGPLSIQHTPVTLIPPGAPTNLAIQVTPNTQQVVPGSPTLHFRTAPGPFTSVPLTSLGGTNYQGVLPAKDCSDDPQYYLSAQGDGGATVTLPANAPTELLSVGVGVVGSPQSTPITGFEGGLPAGWSQTGLWNITGTLCSNPAQCEGASFAYYGNTGGATPCTYATGAAANSGNLTSTLINLPAVGPGGSLKLEYCSALVTENLAAYDHAYVFVNATQVDQAVQSPSWQTRTADITAFAGQTVTLRFFFETVDGVANSFRGWQVDNIRVTATTIECEDCYADCDNSGGLTVADFGCFQTKFVAQDPYADCDQNTRFTVADFGCFQTKFVGGCP